jgi:hypothetical protein
MTLSLRRRPGASTAGQLQLSRSYWRLPEAQLEHVGRSGRSPKHSEIEFHSSAGAPRCADGPISESNLDKSDKKSIQSPHSDTPRTEIRPAGHPAAARRPETRGSTQGVSSGLPGNPRGRLFCKRSI